MNRDDPNPLAKFLGWLLMGVGALIALTTGACTAFFLTMPMLQGGGSAGVGEVMGWVGLVLAVGGLPCLVGICLFFVGRAISRPRSRRRDGDPPLDRGPLE
jgi:hypothetical protein